MKRLTISVVSLLLGSYLMVSSSSVIADDVDDVMSVLQSYAELESDLDAQGQLIRDDRVQIAPTRWTDNGAYMNWQKTERAAYESANGGRPEFLVDIESPEVRVYGDTAVASFVRRQMVMPPGQEPTSFPPLWQTVVLVKEGGEWGIAHTHVSPVGPWN